MKKFLPLVVFVTAIFFFYITCSKVQAEQTPWVESNVTNLTGSVTIGNYNRGQTFKPGGNYLTDIYVYIKDRQVGESLNLSMTTYPGGQTVVSVSGHTINSSGDGWEIFQLDGHGAIPVTKDADYAVYLESSEFTMGWGTSLDQYSRGQYVNNSVLDTGFRIIGYNEEEESEPEPEPKPEPEPEPEPDGDETQDEDTTSGEQPSDKKNSNDLTAEIDDSIGSPELISVKKNNEIVDMESVEEIEVKTTDELELTGTAPTGMTVVIFIGDTAFTVTADELGNWILIFKASDIEVGSYVVEGQTQNSDGKGSDKVTFFDLTRLESQLGGPFTALNVEEKEQTLLQKLTIGALRYITIAFLAILFLTFVALWLFIVWKRGKKEKEGENGTKKKKQEDKVENSKNSK